MKDDYLWDGTGEPDPEVERLEQMLSVYKYQPRPLELPARPGTWFSPRLAAAAALILMAVAGLWVFLNRGDQTPSTIATGNNPAEQQVTMPQDGGDKVVIPTPVPAVPGIAKSQAQRPGVARQVKRSGRVAPAAPDENVEGIAFFDVETARHLEQAQMLLRSFKNVSLDGENSFVDASYEKERSRAILQKNVLLRRNAEAKGNLPAQELLGSLEPLLLDIANLPDRPSEEDVRPVKERIQKTEIIATLQVYSAPIMARSE